MMLSVIAASILWAFAFLPLFNHRLPYVIYLLVFGLLVGGQSLAAAPTLWLPIEAMFTFGPVVLGRRVRVLR